MLANTSSIPALMNERKAAEHLSAFGYPVAATTLRKLRCVGGGPQFVRWGRSVFYRQEDVEAWAVAKLSPPMARTGAAA